MLVSLLTNDIQKRIYLFCEELSLITVKKTLGLMSFLPLLEAIVENANECKKII